MKRNGVSWFWGHRSERGVPLFTSGEFFELKEIVCEFGLIDGI
jgi:hypothetical protein